MLHDIKCPSNLPIPPQICYATTNIELELQQLIACAIWMRMVHGSDVAAHVLRKFVGVEQWIALRLWVANCHSINILSISL